MNLKMTSLAGIAMLVLLAPGWAAANGDGTGIANSPHDFTDNVVAGVAGPPNIENDAANVNAWNNKRKEICRTCHVPHDHGAVRYGNQGILWNHQLTTKASWQMYASDPLMIDFIDGTIEAAPTGTSKLCLGCHDGVSAVNQYDGKAPTDAGYGGGTTYLMSAYDGGFSIGNTAASLTNNHPISVTYDNVADTGLFDPAAATMDNGDTVSSLLDNGRVECSTCHDVHNRESVPGTHLLRESTKGADVTGAGASDLCFVCHDK
ncbi:MAG: hypothetical protein ACE5FL_00665 [Myxococcota bacterium]